MKFTDTHCHLDFDEFSSELPSLIDQCLTANIHQIVIPGITAKHWQRVLNLSKSYPHILPCLGLHPWWLDKATDEQLTTLEHLILTEDLVALGEMGVDGAIDDIPRQLHFFEQQLVLANTHELPVIIHHRKSHHHIQPLLKQYKVAKAGIIHAFSGNYLQAKAYIDLGFKLGIGGTITYERAKKTRDAVAKVPIESLVLETDAPAIPLFGYQGQDNSPLQLPKVFEQLVEIRNESAEALAEQIELNVKEVFGL